MVHPCPQKRAIHRLRSHLQSFVGMGGLEIGQSGFCAQHFPSSAPQLDEAGSLLLDMKTSHLHSLLFWKRKHLEGNGSLVRKSVDQLE